MCFESQLRVWYGTEHSIALNLGGTTSDYPEPRVPPNVTHGPNTRHVQIRNAVLVFFVPVITTGATRVCDAERSRYEPYNARRNHSHTDRFPDSANETDSAMNAHCMRTLVGRDYGVARGFIGQKSRQGSKHERDQQSPIHHGS
jgi:hypothetical protein